MVFGAWGAGNVGKSSSLSRETCGSLVSGKGGQEQSRQKRVMPGKRTGFNAE